MAPTVVYVHGGYWQSLRKEDFAFIAAGPLALGCHVALAEYTLAPQASMTQIVQEIGSCSPLHHIGRGSSTTIAVGSAELPELVRHSVDYAQAAALADEPARYMSIERGDHFSVLEALASADGELAKVVAAPLES